MVSLLVANTNRTRLSFRNYRLLIRMKTFKIPRNMLCCTTDILHTYVIKGFVRSGGNLIPIRMQTSILKYPPPYKLGQDNFF